MLALAKHSKSDSSESPVGSVVSRIFDDLLTRIPTGKRLAMDSNGLDHSSDQQPPPDMPQLSRSSVDLPQFITKQRTPEEAEAVADIRQELALKIESNSDPVYKAAHKIADDYLAGRSMSVLVFGIVQLVEAMRK